MCPRLAGADKGLTQSQSGTGPGVALTTTPTNLLPVCLLDSFCHHRADSGLPLRVRLRRSAARRLAESPPICS